MYALLALTVSIMLATFMTGVASQHRELAEMYQSRIKSLKAIAMAENIQQYFIETSVFPATIATLSASSGFQHTQSLTDSWQGYGLSPTITDTVWSFKRAVFFSNDPSKGVNAASYLTTNACGTGSYATATSWCGAATGQWFRTETREHFNEKISTQRVRMGRVLQRFADYYNANQKFPDKNESAVALGANSISSLNTLAGYGSGAVACTGTFSYMGVPIDCADMFDLWGGVIGYQFITSKHIVLISETPLYNNSDTRVIVAADFDNSLL